MVLSPAEAEARAEAKKAEEVEALAATKIQAHVRGKRVRMSDSIGQPTIVGGDTDESFSLRSKRKQSARAGDAASVAALIEAINETQSPRRQKQAPKLGSARWTAVGRRFMVG